MPKIQVTFPFFMIKAPEPDHAFQIKHSLPYDHQPGYHYLSASQTALSASATIRSTPAVMYFCISKLLFISNTPYFTLCLTYIVSQNEPQQQHHFRQVFPCLCAKSDGSI